MAAAVDDTEWYPASSTTFAVAIVTSSADDSPDAIMA